MQISRSLETSIAKIKELQSEFKIVSDPSRSDPEAQHWFTQHLLESSEPEILEFHYGLLQYRGDALLFGMIRGAFASRGADGEAFLLEKFQQEKDPGMLADALHMLGIMRNRKARELARGTLESPHEKLRNVASYVLGWVGFRKDLPLLEKRLLEDPSPEIRGTAASAFYQLFSRIPAAKAQAVQSLQKALRQEKDEEALASIVVCLQDILKKRFGLREDLSEGEIRGDIETAKVKALKFFDKNPGA